MNCLRKCLRGVNLVPGLAATLVLPVLALSLMVAPAALAASWSSTGSLATARVGHTANLVSNGKVVVAGGKGGAPLASSELYNPATGTWSDRPMYTARYNHTATLMSDGLVLMTGGHDSSDILQSYATFFPDLES